MPVLHKDEQPVPSRSRNLQKAGHDGELGQPEIKEEDAKPEPLSEKSRKKREISWRKQSYQRKSRQRPLKEIQEWWKKCSWWLSGQLREEQDDDCPLPEQWTETRRAVQHRQKGRNVMGSQEERKCWEKVQGQESEEEGQQLKREELRCFGKADLVRKKNQPMMRSQRQERRWMAN